MERLLTPAETAELLRIEVETLYTWVSKRRVPYQKVGRALRFSPPALRAWLATQAWPRRTGNEEGT
jgi:excisionase family DNA binding protein